MPIYEYRCPNGHLLEVFHRMSDPSPTTCEVCGAAPLERVLHPVAVHYKGSGFYSTDYGRGGRKAGKDSGAGDSAGGSSGDSAGGSSDSAAPAKPSSNGAGSSGTSSGSSGSDS
jgi:putative FmdB family regulatory protein